MTTKKRKSTEQEKRQIAAWIRRERLARNWSQDQLAKSLNMSQAVLSRIETGERKVSVLRLSDLAAAFGMTTAQALEAINKEKLE